MITYSNFFKAFFLIVSAPFFFTGCQKNKKEHISLEIWTDKNNRQTITERLEEFREIHKNNVIFDFSLIEKDSISSINNPNSSNPDIFVFTGNQLRAFHNKGLLSEITDEKNQIIEENGGTESGIIQEALIDGKLFAYPELNGDSYFMYYNKKFFNEDDLTSFERMNEVAAAKGKKITMDIYNGWYLYSFFKGAGLDIHVNKDGKTNFCNWNAKDTAITGVEVAKAITKLAKMEGFLPAPDNKFISLIENEKSNVIAGINGPWNSKKTMEIWGDDFGAVQLPKFMVGQKAVQMHSAAGYKYVSVHAFSKSKEWAHKVARWITNEDSQIAIFKNTGECPSNIKAAASIEVHSSPAIMALSNQAQFSHSLNAVNPFWEQAKLLGIMLGEGLGSDKEIQTQLDKMVSTISNGQ